MDTIGRTNLAESYRAARARPKLDLHIASVLREASEAVTHVGKWLAQENVDPECIGDFTLVLAEALNNVIEHAYGADANGLIEIRATMRPTALSVQIIDEGKPFDGPPDEVPLNTVDKELADMPEGGFGWFLIQSLTEDIHFSHDNGKNKLTLVVALRSAPV